MISHKAVQEAIIDELFHYTPLALHYEKGAHIQNKYIVKVNFGHDSSGFVVKIF